MCSRFLTIYRILESPLVHFFCQKLNKSTKKRCQISLQFFFVLKSRKVPFVLDAPSSIAVASNAHFISEYKNDILFDNLSYSMFTSLEGRIEIENIVSESFMNIRKGETVISTRDGKFLQLDTFRNQMFIENTLRGD